LIATGFIDEKHGLSLLDDVEELLKIIGKILVTTRRNS